MGRVSLVVSSILLVLCCAAAGSTFDDSNPIRLVSDDFESRLIQLIGHTRHALSFARFAHRYGKEYESVEEIKLRFQIFSDNLKLIRSTNRKASSYKLAVNRFADWTWEEFQGHRLGAAQNCSATLKGNHKLTDAALPELKDWRVEGIVSPIKDQGHCGSCWTFRLVWVRFDVLK
ncbi:pro-cathepsin H [Quercus suber]|uniref:pro-cathepsin H n=1 Tax=Quercus suber TaxID=58331 RepID=UPI0032DF6D67